MVYNIFFGPKDGSREVLGFMNGYYTDLEFVKDAKVRLETENPELYFEIRTVKKHYGMPFECDDNFYLRA